MHLENYWARGVTGEIEKKKPYLLFVRNAQI